MSVLVTNASWRIAKEAMLSLNKHKVHSVAGDEKLPLLNLYSNTSFVQYANPESGEFARSLYNICKEKNVETIFSMSDALVVPIAKNKAMLNEVCEVPLPDYQYLLKAHDKFETYKVSRDVGVPTPDSFVFKNMEDLARFAETARYPLIIKPRMGGGASAFLHKVTSKEELTHFYSHLLENGREPIIQEYIPGSSKQMYMIDVLYDKDYELTAFFMANKIREYPPTGGITCCGVSIYEPLLLEYAKKIFKELRWYGVAEVEFKLDPRDNMFKLIEINPRFWQYLKLPISCGVDFPFMLYEISTGKDVAMQTEYSIGVHYINVIKDVPSFANSFFRSDSKLEYLGSVYDSYKGKKVFSSRIGLESLLWRI